MTHTKSTAVAMDLGFKETPFTTVSSIKIPEVFYRRFKTGIPALDEIFGDGFLPGSSFTITAGAGTGKTTLMLQLLESLALNQGKRVGYATGEESHYQLAFTCSRLGVKHVQVAYRTDVDELINDIKKHRLDVLICDSFQCLRTKNENKPKATEEYVTNALCRAAKETECVIGFIMHQTKNGKLKGSTLVPHSVDMNMHMSKGDTEFYGDNVRILEVEKNRFGMTGEIELEMGERGFNFAAEVSAKAKPLAAKSSTKSADRKQAEFVKIVEAANTSVLRFDAVMAITGNLYRAKNHLKELEALNKLVKHGRGNDAYWTAIPQA